MEAWTESDYRGKAHAIFILRFLQHASCVQLRTKELQILKLLWMLQKSLELEKFALCLNTIRFASLFYAENPGLGETNVFTKTSFS